MIMSDFELMMAQAVPKIKEHKIYSGLCDDHE
jgi:hypothetical protein